MQSLKSDLACLISLILQDSKVDESVVPNTKKACLLTFFCQISDLGISDPHAKLKDRGSSRKKNVPRYT